MTEKEAQLLAQAEAWVKEKLAADASGHDFWHVIRVCRLAKIIAQEEEEMFSSVSWQLSCMIWLMTNSMLIQRKLAKIFWLG